MAREFITDDFLREVYQREAQGLGFLTHFVALSIFRKTKENFRKAELNSKKISSFSNFLAV
jgi:hypothetical protein